MGHSATKNAYNTSVTFEKSMLAPCGMNCGSCIGYMRPKNKCPGCRQADFACLACPKI